MNPSVRRPLRRAFALAYFLLICALLVLLTGAIVAVCRRQLFGSSSAVEHNRALYAAESGLSYAIEQLETNAAWTTGFNARAALDGYSSYTVTFAANPSTATSMESINNLSGSSAVDSYRGPGTVPPHSALLVVQGQAGQTRQVVEALLVPGANTLQGYAIAASGQISMAGNVSVDGIRSLSDLSPIPASLHSNRPGAGLQIAYNPLGGTDALSVSGAVTSSGSSAAATAIQLAAPATVGSKNSQVPAKKYPSINIEAIISDHSGSPGPAIPAVPGPFTLTGGDNYYSGDVVINGDLTLNSNARLYVSGNLTINGSIKGAGALVVKGNTRLYGDADIQANSSDYISLLSKGSVVLQGFDGQTYLNSLASTNSAVAERWTDLQFAVGQLQGYLQSHSAMTPAALGAQMQSDDAYLDQLGSIVSAPWQSTLTDPLGRTRHQNTTADLRAAVGTGSPTQQFLNNRLQALDDMFRICWNDRSGGAAARYTATALIDNFTGWDPTQDGGLFDSIQSFNQIDTAARASVLQNIQLMIHQFDYNRLGSANFKGFVYTNGAFVATSDVNLLGAVIVNGNSAVGPITVGANTYQPGDFTVKNNSRITYVDDMFQNGVQNIQGIGALDVKRWVNR